MPRTADNTIRNLALGGTSCLALIGCGTVAVGTAVYLAKRGENVSTIGASAQARLTSVDLLPKTPGTLSVPTQTPWIIVKEVTPTPEMHPTTARVVATVPTVKPSQTPVKETLLSCDQIKQGGPIMVSKPMPEVPVSSLIASWPNGETQNVFGSAIHSLVTQEPGAIVFSPDQKGNPDLEKVVQDGYAFWIGKDNQWVLGSSGTVKVETNVTTLMASFGEGSLRIGDRTYYFPQEDKDGGTEYIVLVSTKGDKGSITNVKADCLIDKHNQFNTLPNGRYDVPASAEYLDQQVINSLKRANRVVFVTIDPFRNVMTATEKFRSGDWRLLVTNVNVDK